LYRSFSTSGQSKDLTRKANAKATASKAKAYKGKAKIKA